MYVINFIGRFSVLCVLSFLIGSFLQRNLYIKERTVMDENRYDSNQQYNNGYDQQYDGQQYNNGHNLEDVVATAEQEKHNRNAYYESVETPTLMVQMKTTPFIIAMVIGFGGMSMFAPIDFRISFLCIGIMLIIFGMAAVTDEKFKFRKHAKSTLILILGIVIVLISVYLILAKFIPSLPQPNITVMLGIGFTAIGALLFVLCCISFCYTKKVCTEQVQGVCVYLKRKSEYKDGHTHIEYAPVYEYQFRGNTYCAGEDFRRNNVPSIGDRFELYINPDEPTDFYRKEWQSKAEIVIVCVVFIVFGCLLFYISPIV